MHSIRGKFLLLIIVSILLCTVILGGISVAVVSGVQEKAADRIMNLTCQEEGTELNAVLGGIRSAVDVCAELVDDGLNNLEDLRNDAYLETYMNEMRHIAYSVANNSDGICSYYVRLDPSVTNGPAGFFFTRNSLAEPLTEEPLTDLSLYAPDDTEHVGWFYQPKAAGEPLWMEPYLNKNLDIYMISYIVPLFRDGRFWGVVGMDVDFGVIIDYVRSMHPYETGFGSLTDQSGKVYYHPELETGTYLNDHAASLSDMIADFSNENVSKDKVYTHRDGSVVKKTVFTQLQNGMELVLTVDRSETAAPGRQLILILLGIAVILAVTGVILTLALSNRITGPLRALTAAADEIAGGNLDVQLPKPGTDEVGKLTRSFAVTMESLREYISGISNKAFVDSLTHVRNKAAFDRNALQLQEQIDLGQADFGLVMVDLNDLKVINDTYGHDRGDDYLCESCQLICRVFKHSPVFRIGGDEFVVILEGEEKGKYGERCEEMKQGMKRSKKEAEPWKRLAISMGVAYVTPEDLSVEDVFRRADQAMYQEKCRMKGENTLPRDAQS